ncbi:putative two-component system sensor kinase [Actinoplanes missouriensis 431]|uniref:histidine kinase n=1 Tax=Actinoplanes missouriensis (strain ATCC 14538 / DSM 43046 / CBS 188.64 / JCM 3121 / NBRC 102363 / NCIMB 12654 / NRRL B-3342 / UNCC 431) TaxID=512565 RepID=I0H569_ACTM4|nr:sensor histidine kinase [Actinoplanes missouriensis]BAL88156.1 putative two-component system sensor kinase [Actinoplanes missouriensis 431]
MHRPTIADTALAVTLLLTCVVVNSSDETASEPGVLWWAAAVLATAAVALRRRWPVVLLAVCCAAAVIPLAGGMPLTIINLSVPILLYTVAVRHGWARSLAVLAALLVLAVGSSTFAVREARPAPELQRPPFPVPEPRPFPEDPAPRPLPDDPVEPSLTIAWNDLPGLILILVAAWAIGSGTRSRRAYLAELRARAVDRERERGQQAVLAVAAERGRISRELHDVVAHGLSVMVIQAQGGAAALDNRPADTRAALEAIIKTGRDSLADMRRVLSTVGEVDDAWHPQPGLAMLPALVDQVRETTGTPVGLRVEGTAVPVPSAVDLSAYRIVQEALTNTMKHAGAGAGADVVVAYATGSVEITVSDDGSVPAHHDGMGTGLRGMRERVRLLGGRFDAGPGPQGGFVVRAVLPVEERPT